MKKSRNSTQKQGSFTEFGSTSGPDGLVSNMVANLTAASGLAANTCDKICA